MAGAYSSKQRTPRASAIDREVGLRIRLRRQAVGLSQQQMAELTGTTYQQVHKYEKGINRLSAGQLHAIALALGTAVVFFFDDIEADPIKPRRKDLHRQIVDITSIVLRIKTPEHRQAVCMVAKALAERADQQPAEPA